MENKEVLILVSAFIVNVVLTILDTKRGGFLNPICLFVCLVPLFGTLVLSIICFTDFVNDKIKSKRGY